MLSKKLITVLSTYSRLERKHFRKYLRSPYFNESGELIDLFEIIDTAYLEKHQGNGISEPGLSKREVWKKLKKTASYDDNYLRRICSELTQHGINFLQIQRNKKLPFQPFLEQLQVLKERKLEKYFHSTAQKMTSGLSEAEDLAFTDFHFFQYAVADLSHRTLEASGKKLADFTQLEQADFHLDCFYFLQKLKYLCDTLGYRKFLSIETDILILPGFIQFLEHSKYVQEPALKAYLLVLKMLMHEEEENHFFSLRDFLKAQRRHFSQEELNTLYIYLKNYCIDTKINKGRSDYLQELFQLFQTLIDDEILITDGKLDSQDYKNIITVALYVKAFDWAENFIKTHTDYLPETDRKNALTYNLAKVYFHRKKYPMVIAQLREVEYDNVVYALGSKLMLLKTYYEQDEYLALDSLVDSFRIYLQRNRFISKDVRRQYLNVLRFIRKLANINPYDRRAIEKVRQKVNECQALADKNWILEKIVALEKDTVN
ncbi:MAG: hypothetical protein DHS20C18_05440 [Saprospiraceae bacterium]|nr:MAG: hypothetical protein DHS20C18_05440 [Saprospiraceae bacterium]